MRRLVLTCLLLLLFSARARAQTGVAEVAVTGDEGAAVLLDGKPAGTLPLSQPLQVPAGSHRLRLEKGKRRVETQVQVQANRPLEVRFTFVPPVALTTPTSGAVLLADLDGVPAALAQRLIQSASRAAVEERLLLIPPERVAGSEDLTACRSDAACQERLAARAEAQYVLLLRAGGQLPLSATVYDVAASATAAAGEDVCTRCGADEVQRRLGQLVGRVVREATTRPRGSVDIASVPPGAEVALDRHLIGRTPLRKAVLAGSHEVELSKDGYLPLQQTLQVADGQVATMKSSLRAIPAPPPPPRRELPPVVVAPRPVPARPFYRKWWFWTALGAVAVGTTAAVLGVYYSGELGPQTPPRMFLNPHNVDF